MGAFYPMVSHACHIPIVEVDPETGVVTILKYYAVNDCGTIMNPPLVEGQIMGGIVQGIGAALMEEYDYDATTARCGTPSLREYLIPTLHEVPEIVIEHLQTPSPFTEYGVKGAGEGGRLVAPTAIASAVSDALRPLGVFIDELPMTPERIVAAVQAARQVTDADSARRWGPPGAVPDVGAGRGPRRLVRDGPPVLAWRPARVQRHAALPRPPDVPGAVLPHAARPAGRAGEPVGARRQRRRAWAA